MRTPYVNLIDLDDSPPRLLKIGVEIPIARRVLRLGTWVMLAVLTQFFVNAADNYMVGRLDGPVATASQAALALGTPLFWAVGGFFSAVNFGAQALTGRRYAESAYERVGQVLFNALVISIIAGVVGAALGYLAAAPSINYLAEASAEQKTLGTSYAQIRMYGVPGMVITFGYKAFFDGIGRTYVHLWAALTMNLINIGLNYLLIYGSPALGIPQLELDGAGIASVLSTYVGLAIMIGVSFLRRYLHTYRFYRLRHFDPKIAGRIVRLMLPAGSATLVLMVGFLLVFRVVGLIDAQVGGNTNTAATNAIVYTMALCFMPLIAFGTATATAVSQSLGAGKTNLAARYGWESVRLGVFAMVVVATFFMLFPESLITFWAPNDPAVPKAGAAALRIMATSLPMMVLGLILSNSLYGAGANTFVMVVQAILLCFLVPASWLFGPVLGFGMEGVWWSLAMFVNCFGVAMGLKFLGRGWQRIRL